MYNKMIYQSKIRADASNCKDLDMTIVNAVLLEMSISKLNNSKAVGIDGLQKEHLTNAHPILYSTRAKLFYLMFYISYVPKQFGCGIIIPIQKDSSIKGMQHPDNFRRITLSPLIAKVFEHCILFIYKSYLKTNDRQLGF